MYNTNYLKFLDRFKNAELISSHKLIDKSGNYYGFVVAVTNKEGFLPAVDLGNYDHAYTIFSINKFGEFKFHKLNIVDIVDKSTHFIYWQVYYKL